MLKLEVPSLLSTTEATPLSSATAIRTGSMSPQEITSALEHLHISLMAIAQILRRTRILESDTFQLVDTDGVALMEFGNDTISIRNSSGVLQQVVTVRQTGPAALSGFPIGGTAGATYTATEQGLINTIVTQVNSIAVAVTSLRAALLAHGLTS